MKRIGIILAMTWACTFVWGAGDEKTPEVPAAASPAMRKYQAALAAADLERNKAVEKARVALVADLKSAQKHALEGGDVDRATGMAVLAKKFAGPAVTAATFAGSTWNCFGDRIRLNADGSITHSDTRYSGTWAVISERSVAIFFAHGYVDVWTFDAEGRAYKAVAFKRDREYEGNLAR